MKKLWLLVLVLGFAGCANRPPPPQEPAFRDAGFARRMESSPGSERQVIRTSELTLTVSSSADASKESERLVRSAGGYLERSSNQDGDRVVLRCRVPAAQLDAILDSLSRLGTEAHRSVSAEDVTDEYADLDARLRTQIALRGRLQQLLDKAKDVPEILSIERELTRVQMEIESMQGRLDRMKSQVQLSVLTINLEPKRILGPLGYVGYGLYWITSKLIFIR